MSKTTKRFGSVLLMTSFVTFVLYWLKTQPVSGALVNDLVFSITTFILVGTVGWYGISQLELKDEEIEYKTELIKEGGRLAEVRREEINHLSRTISGYHGILSLLDKKEITTVLRQATEDQTAYVYELLRTGTNPADYEDVAVFMRKMSEITAEVTKKKNLISAMGDAAAAVGVEFETNTTHSNSAGDNFENINHEEEIT